MKFKLSVDDEFKRIAPPMSRSEYEELEKSIMAEGCRDPIVVWNGTILDGHHRYVICRHHDIRFNIKTMYMESREEAIAWIRLASVLGANDAVGDKNLPFPGTKLFSVGVVLNNVFSKLFEAIEAGETIDMPVEVKQAIHFYFHQLGVDIEDRLKGLYYSIPD